MAQTGGTGRFDYLDGIRAVAIVAVLSLHWLGWYTPLFHGGSVGVDVFFVLSGFVITTMLWRRPVRGVVVADWLAFLDRRVLRLYPALLGLVVGCVGLYALVPWAAAGPLEVARRGSLALGQASAVWAARRQGSLWLPGLQPFGQTWSLAVEWYFYVAWPLLVLGARSRGWRPRRLAAATAAVAVTAYALSLPLGTFWFYFGPTARCAELLVGAALALWLAGGRPIRPRWGNPAASVSLAVIAAYTLLGADGHSPLYRYVGVPGVVLATVVLIHTGYSTGGGPVHRLLGHPWAAAVGRHSYSLYLWHIVPFLLLQRAPLPRPVLGLLAVGAAVALTLASHRWLERPFLRPRGDLLRPRRENRTAPALVPAGASPGAGATGPSPS